MTNDQPMPKQGITDVTPVAKRMFIGLLEAQSAKGLATYGTTLQTFPTRYRDVVKLQGGTGSVCTAPIPNTTNLTREIVMRSQRTMPPRLCAQCGEPIARRNARRFCSVDCYRISQPTLAERFWSKVDMSGGPDACWPWVAATDGAGYGCFQIWPKLVKAHKFSLESVLGRPVAVGKYACHHCDNPPCCNPVHLFEGTPKQNQEDSRSKGRTAYQKGTRRLPHGDQHWTRRDPERAAQIIKKASAAPRKPARGEHCHSARLTAVDVLAIRAAYRPRIAGASLKDLATKYGVAVMTVQNIVTRKTWRHV